MAKEAEAIREKRSRIIKAEAEQEASNKLNDAAKIISENPSALELRRMQMITEVGAENNTTTDRLLISEQQATVKVERNHISSESQGVRDDL